QGLGDLGGFAEGGPHVHGALPLGVGFHLGADQGEYSGVHIGVGERKGGPAQHFAGSGGQQCRVPRARPYEQDPPRMLLAGSTHRLFSIGLGSVKSVAVLVPAAAEPPGGAAAEPPGGAAVVPPDSGAAALESAAAVLVPTGVVKLSAGAAGESAVPGSAASSSRAPSSSSSRASARPSSAACAGAPTVESLITSEPSTAAAQPRSDSPSTMRPSSSNDSTISAIAPTSAVQPASSSASRARS